MQECERARAEDLVQEAFLRFVGRLHHLARPRGVRRLPPPEIIGSGESTGTQLTLLAVFVLAASALVVDRQRWLPDNSQAVIAVVLAVLGGPSFLRGLQALR